jgi:hypothetical protein
VTLQVPLRERNALLLAAGYAPVYPERAFGSEEMGTIRAALDRFLRAAVNARVTAAQSWRATARADA